MPIGLTAKTYKEINKDGKYANFTPLNILKAALFGDNQVEYTDGQTSGSMIKDPKTGKVYVHLTDRTGWDLTPEERSRYDKTGTIASRVRTFMADHGSNDKSNTGNRQSLYYEIPSDTISGDYRGRLRDIPSGNWVGAKSKYKKLINKKK